METAIQKSTKRDALSLTGSGALGTTKKKKIAVEEEEYNKELSNIVQRDFFPDVKKLQPLEEGDSCDVTNEKIDSTSGLHLDQFLNKYESEDDSSFADMLVKSKEAHKQKYPWLHDKHDGCGKLAVEGGQDTWRYTAKNSLMYVPEGVESSAVEMVQGASMKREIVHANTRLPSQFVHKCQPTSDHTKKFSKDKVDVDGKTTSTDSPEINGYNFLSTPHIQPGVDASPLMTWGSVEGTPMRLDPDSRPFTSTGPSFKMPKIPDREKVAQRLVEQAAKATRERDKKTPASHFRMGVTTPSKLDRLQLLSPAARKLVKDKTSDKALSASYSPRLNSLETKLKTPISRTSTQSTPSLTDDLLNIVPKK